MSRVSPYLGIVVGLLFGVFIIALFNNTTAVRVPASSTAADDSPTLVAVIPVISTTTPTQTIPEQEKNTTTKIIPTTTPVSVPVVAPFPVTIPTKITVAEENAALDVSSSKLRAALVNIICSAPKSSGVQSISAGGVFIDSKGIILTNAHVAQYFLLADRGVSCVIRSGSPAVNKYYARLIYISPTWINSNADVLTKMLPHGTGEYDFAFLAVSKSMTRDPLPSSFPFVQLAATPSSVGTPVVIASYGAQFIETSQIESNLSPIIVFGLVKDIFTFGTNTVDVLDLGGSAAAQEGSSGGGVADVSGELVGTITTSTVSGSTDTRSLSAITASYIRAGYASETGQALDLLLAKPTATSIIDFSSKIPALEAVLTSQLP